MIDKSLWCRANVFSERMTNGRMNVYEKLWSDGSKLKSEVTYKNFTENELPMH